MSTIAELDLLVKEAQRRLAADELEAAEAVCGRLLTAMPDHPGGLMILCIVFMRQGRTAEAEAFLTHGAALYPTVLGFHSTLARVRLRAGRWADAMEPLEACVLLDPDTREHRISLLAVYQTRLFSGFSALSKRAMAACLADDSLTHTQMNKAWLSLLKVDPESARLLAVFDSPTYETFAAQVSAGLLADWQRNQFLNAGLDRFLVADPTIERGLTFARRWFSENDAARDAHLPLLCGLARYVFHSEYVFETRESWHHLRDDLSTAARVAMLGCYEALFEHADIAEKNALSDERCFQDLLRVQVAEPRRELALRPTILALAPIDDDVSLSVQAQYEANPYPRWTTVGALPADRPSDQSSNQSSNQPWAAVGGAGKNVLIAGCGTGREAVEAALLFDPAPVYAIDLSRASLAYGVRKSEELGVHNVFFRQADILDVGRMEKTFDLIMSSGVLHHMRDPSAGLRALLAVLRPAGVLRLGLYSTIARAAVVTARAWIARAGFAPTPEGIRAFRVAVLALPEGDELRRTLTTAYDFYSLSACRDFLFHVQEHTFTLPQLAALARAFSLTVLRVDTKSPAHLALYHARFPDDATATNLQNWHLHEQEHPTTFAGMYSLWLCRTSEAGVVDLACLPGFTP